MSKLVEIHPFVKNILADCEKYKVSEDKCDPDKLVLDGFMFEKRIFELGVLLRATKEYRNCKFVGCSFSDAHADQPVARRMHIYFNGNHTTSGFVEFDVYTDEWCVVSDSINRERGRGYGRYSSKTKSSRNIKSAVTNCKKFMQPLSNASAMQLTKCNINESLFSKTSKAAELRYSARHGIRYLNERGVDVLLKSIPNIVEFIDCFETKKLLTEAHVNFSKANELFDKTAKQKSWVIRLVDNGTNALICERGYSVETKQVSVADLDPVIVEKLFVLNMLSEGDYVEDVGSKIDADSYIVIIESDCVDE
jgi:hypothetical protein